MTSLSVSLDPAMYAHSGIDVVHTGIMEDPATGAIVEMQTSQVNLVIQADSGSELGFVVWDAWPDIDVTLAEPTGTDLLEYLKELEGWREATPLGKAFLHRKLESGMVPPMKIQEIGDKGTEAIAIPAQGEDGLIYCALVSYDAAGLIAISAEHEMVACPYAPAAGEQGGGVPGIADLDDQSVFAAYSRDFPAEAAAVADLREKLERIMEDNVQQAVDVAARGIADRDFSDDVFPEDFFIPTLRGLYFPKLGDAGEYLAYDDPAAEPYLEILRDSGWDGEMMLL